MCRVEDCENKIDRKGLCSIHYMRQWRYGTTELTRTRKEILVHSQGYLLVSKKGHPLADSTGYVYEHRYVYYEANGAGPFNCHWCTKEITWPKLHIDHLDEDKKNNTLQNLKATCPQCNMGRGAQKRIQAWRDATGIEYNGKIYSMQELSDIRGISRQSLIYRLKKMDITTAMSTPRGKTGPKKQY